MNHWLRATLSRWLGGVGAIIGWREAECAMQMQRCRPARRWAERRWGRAGKQCKHVLACTPGEAPHRLSLHTPKHVQGGMAFKQGTAYAMLIKGGHPAEVTVGRERHWAPNGHPSTSLPGCQRYRSQASLMLLHSLHSHSSPPHTSNRAGGTPNT